MRLAYCVSFLLFLSQVTAAQTPSVYTPNEPARALKEGKILHASRLTTAAPVIDGAVDEEAWSAAPSAGGYLQRDPDNGTAMTEQTRIQVVYDDRYLYIAVICEDSAPGAIAMGLSRREDLGATDYVSVGFDPRHDRLTAYVFQANASQTRYTDAVDAAQWIENTDTDGDGNDDHVYGTLSRNVVDLTVRGTYSVHRDLTIQAYRCSRQPRRTAARVLMAKIAYWFNR